jgi:selT/selW/selH-like putative selenoprotein
MHSQFPGLRFRGGIYHPGDLQMMASQLLQLAFFGGLAVSLVGRAVLPENYGKFLEANQMPILGACFLCNVIAGNLLSTGAFEVAYNGDLVWSKIETGRFPQMDELRNALTDAVARANGEEY